MSNINSLTLEQKFKLAIYKNKVYKLTHKQIKKYLLNTLRKMMIKDNLIKYYIKHYIE